MGFPLASSDYVAAKSNWVRFRFTTCNFSLILKGQGEYLKDGKTWTVHAPCVITQWPGEWLEYGPLDGTWTEWYCVYDRSLFRAFQMRGLIDRSRPVWPVADPVSLHLHLAEFAVLTRSEDPGWVVDLVDRVAERAILSTWLPPEPGWQEDSGIRAVAKTLREDLARPWDFSELAAKAGYSLTTFRRRWVESFGRPPADSLRHLRLTEACRLLVETQLLIKEIAALTGFEDELYFSRRFRQDIGHSPREYRRIYRLTR
jgi:AraC-like DNA-binding protein